MYFAPSISAIIAETHARFWHLPDFVRERERQARNVYMRNYMRTYRQGKEPPLTITLNDEQRRRLTTDARRAGYRPTPYFRAAAFAYLDRRLVLPKAFEQALAATTIEIRRIGNSINQLAHQANLKRHTARRELERANVLLEELQQTIDRFVPALPSDHDR